MATHDYSRRLIDQETGTRQKPVRVLLLGGPRTGTVCTSVL